MGGSLRELPGERLRRLRLAKGMTKRQLGEKLGLTDDQIHHWETSWNRIPITHLHALARMFNKSIDYMVTGREASRHEALIRAIELNLPRERLLALTRGSSDA